MQLLSQYYVNYDVKVFQSTCGIRRATSHMHGPSTREMESGFSVIIIIIIKNEKIRVTLCENAAGALYIVNKMCVDIVFSIFPRGTKDTYSQPTDKLHVVTTAAAAAPRVRHVWSMSTSHTLCVAM